MKGLSKLAAVTGILVLCACASGRYGDQGSTPPGTVDCRTVLCAACPEGQQPELKPPDCCRCVPVDTKARDCSTVRCAACPEGQHPALTPPDCCRCVPD